MREKLLFFDKTIRSLLTTAEFAFIIKLKNHVSHA